MSHLSLVRADSPAPAPLPASRVVQLPDGQRVALLPRGVHRAPCMEGDCFVIFAVDSSGDCRGIRALVPATATAEDLRAAELDLWRRLDACDPVVTLHAMRGPAEAR